jgi:hypothetical protein
VWRRGRKCGEIRLKEPRKCWADPTDRKPFIRFHCLVGLMRVLRPIVYILGLAVLDRGHHLAVGGAVAACRRPGRSLVVDETCVRVSRLGDRLTSRRHAAYKRAAPPTQAARRATLIDLASQLPAAVLADLLNLSPITAVR